MNRKHTVLHVDDDPAILKLVNHKLTNAGYEVVSIDDPRAAIKTAMSTGARIIILDVDMPHIDGLSLLREIKTHDGGLHVIMLTGLVSMTSVMQSMIGGAEACLFKPLESFDELEDVLSDTVKKIDRWWTTLYDRSRRLEAEKPEQGAQPELQPA